MSIPVELADLAEATRAHDYAYLVTLTDGGAAHVVAVTPVVEGDVLRITGLGRQSVGNASARATVTLVWPPRSVEGHSLIVDGLAARRDATAIVVTPSRAVLHRPAPRPESEPERVDGEDASSGCASECVELSLARGDLA